MYQRILTAIDNICSDNNIIQTTQTLAKSRNTTITLLHSIRKLPAFAIYFSLVSMNNLETRYSKSVKEKLDNIVATKKFQCKTLVDFGSIQSAVRKYCNETNADLVVIKKGRAARALLQSPPCDMLIISK